MDNTRCVIANMPQRLLADIVEDMVAESGVIDVVDRVARISEIPSRLQPGSVDLLVLGMQGNDLPEYCADILDTAPGVSIVGLVDDGRRLAVFLDNIGKRDILEIIHVLRRSGGVST